MIPAFGAARRVFPGLAAALVISTLACAAAGPAGAGEEPGEEPGEELANPVLGDPGAIAEGRRLYRTRCIICHRNAGGRGPNLFDSAISGEGFLEVVINGRKGTQMPAFGLRMSPEEVWRVHAFVKSSERY